jgi:ADP-heptose:LPS heptosyltransferase
LYKKCYIFQLSKSTNLMMEPIESDKLPCSLVVFPGSLGDFICFLPTLNRIERSSGVDLFARADFADLVSSRIRVRSVDSFEIRRLFVPGGAGEERVKSFFAGYESVYSWMGSGVTEFTAQLSVLTGGRARLFPFHSPHRGIHQTDYFLHCIGTSPATTIPRVGVRADALEWAKARWREHALFNRPVLAVAPGSGAREKNWPVRCFAAVAQWWRQRTHGAVIVVLGPVEEEREGYDLLCRDSLSVRNLSLARLAAVLSRCDVYLGNDSGITHLAAAVGAPTLALFGPSDISRWVPKGGNVTALTRGEQCSPCTASTMKTCSHRRCLTTMEPVVVIRQLEQLLTLAGLTRGEVRITVNR